MQISDSRKGLGRLSLLLACLCGSPLTADQILVNPGIVAASRLRMETALLSAKPSEEIFVLNPVSGDACHVISFHPREHTWNLSAFRWVEFALTNSGQHDVEVTLWALSPGGWSGASTYPNNTNGRVSLKAGAGGVFPVDLWARFPGPDKFSGVANPSEVSCVKVVLQPCKTNGMPCLQLGSIRATGSAPSDKPDISRRVRVPEITIEAPAAGKRVWRQLSDYSSTRLRHVLTLPREWRPGGRYPIIVEYTGNEFYHKFCHSTGLTEQGTMAYGLARGERFICLNLPFVSLDGQREQHSGWGSEQKTIDYCKAALQDAVQNFGGDPGAVVLTGFSRGQIAMNYIGLRDEQLAKQWLAFIGADPGKRWTGGAGWHQSHIGWDERAARMNGRAFFDEHPKFGAGVHVDVEYLEDCESTRNTRAWLVKLIKEPQAMTADPTELQLENSAVRFQWSRGDDGWRLKDATLKSVGAIGAPSGAYTLLHSVAVPAKEPVAIPFPNHPDGFPEPSYGWGKTRWREALSPVPLNRAGESFEFFPDSAMQTADGLAFSRKLRVGDVSACWRLDHEAPGDLCVELKFTASVDGYYSLATPSLVVLQTNDLIWAMVPGVFAGKSIERDFVAAYAYGQGLPAYPVVVPERTASSLISLVTTRNGATLGVIAEPGFSVDPWAYDRNTRQEWRLGLSHMNRKSEISPTLYHPVLGEVDSKMKAGESRVFRLRYSLRNSGWMEMLNHTVYDIYRFKDFEKLKQPEKSLSQRLLALHRYLRDPELSRWRVEDFNGTTIGAQQYGTTNNSGVVGSSGDAMKNSDYGAMWMLAGMTGDAVLVKERLPYARAFKLQQQQVEPGFFQGAAVGQYYLWKSKRFTEEWGDYVEPVALTYYTLSDLGNMILFDPKDKLLRDRLRLGAERLLAWQQSDGRWEVAYDRKTEKPVFTDLVDYRPTFYGMLIAYRVLGDQKYLEAAKRGADWLIENAVKPGRYLGVCGDIRFAPDFATAQIAQGLLDLHEATGDKRYLDAGLDVAKFYITSIYTHPIPSTKTKFVNKKPRTDWEISQVGLGFEHGGIIGSANLAGPILLASHAGLFVRAHRLTGEPLFLDMARAGALSRDAFLDPSTQVASYYWLRMNAGSGPFPHHAWWQIGWIVDYLISEAELRSSGKIHFPRGFFTPKVGPHAAYGFAPGKVFGETVTLAWGDLACDNPSVDWLLAKSQGRRGALAILLNNSPIKAYLGIAGVDSDAKLLSASGEDLKLQANASGASIEIPPFGLVVLKARDLSGIMAASN